MKYNGFDDWAANNGILLMLILCSSIIAALFLCQSCTTTKEIEKQTNTQTSTASSDSVKTVINPHSFDTEIHTNVQIRNDRAGNADSILDAIDPVLSFDTVITENDGRTQRRILGRADIKNRQLTLSSEQVNPDTTTVTHKFIFKASTAQTTQSTQLTQSWIDTAFSYFYFALAVLAAGVIVYLIFFWVRK